MFTQEGSAWKFNNPHDLWFVLIVTIHFILFLLNQNQNHSSITKKIMFGVDVYSFKWKRTELYGFWNIFFWFLKKFHWNLSLDSICTQWKFVELFLAEVLSIRLEYYEQDSDVNHCFNCLIIVVALSISSIVISNAKHLMENHLHCC